MRPPDPHEIDIVLDDSRICGSRSTEEDVESAGSLYWGIFKRVSLKTFDFGNLIDIQNRADCIRDSEVVFACGLSPLKRASPYK